MYRKFMNKYIIKHQTVSTDFLLNLLSSVMVIGMSQLIIYPALSSVLTHKEYGVLLTLMGVLNTIAVSFGGSLNNTRLLVDTYYRENLVNGDFQLITLGSIAISVFFINILLYSFFCESAYVVAGLSLYALFSIIRNYYSVEYRLYLSYKKILKISLLVSLGNLLGLGILFYIQLHDLWPIVFVLGEFSGCIYIYNSSKLIHESFTITFLFRNTVGKVLVLLLTAITSNLFIYVDRLLLLPLLGGTAVSVFTIASCFGKSFGLIMNPLSGVLLSYYAQDNYELNRKKYIFQNLAFALLGIIVFIMSIYLSKIFVCFFYPSFIELVDPYLLLANGATIIATLGNLVQPSVLKYAPTIWQLIIQAVYGCVYLALSFFLVSLNGLMGFAIATMASSCLKYLMTFVCGLYYIGKKDSKWRKSND